MGPHTQYGYGFMHEMQLLAAAGNVVLFTNPRGSLGYGKDFALALRVPGQRKIRSIFWTVWMPQYNRALLMSNAWG